MTLLTVRNNYCFKVSEISAALKQLVEENFFDIKVQGEISGFKSSSVGHSYFNLKDGDVVLNSVCWRNTLQNMPIKIEDGMEVICSGKISIYPGRSSYQLIVNKVEIAGHGILLEMLEKRKKALTAEGLFDISRKKKLPFLPKIIGLITSMNGAVVKDILHRISDRFPTEILIWNVSVQGLEAAHQIKSAIDGFNKLPRHINKPDLIIIARGGGSIEDLWCFNEEEVVRAIFRSAIPIISAIGHETDSTLADFVSDLRAPTPTAAAEFAVPVLSNLRDCINFTSDKVYKIIKFFFEKNGLKISKFNNTLIKTEGLLKLKKQKISEYKYKIEFFIKRNFDKKHSLITLLLQFLEKYDQAKILKMGFAIIYETSKNHIITSANQLLSQMEITIEMHDGKKNTIIKKQS